MLSDELCQLLDAGPAMVVGSVSPDGEPDCIRAWGAEASADGTTIRLLFPEGTAATLVSNALSGSTIAFNFSNVTTYASYQAKGELVRIEAACPADQARSLRHRERFSANVISIGVSADVRNCAFQAAQVLVFRVRSLFDQSPGPGAGRSMGEAP